MRNLVLSLSLLDLIKAVIVSPLFWNHGLFPYLNIVLAVTVVLTLWLAPRLPYVDIVF